MTSTTPTPRERLARAQADASRALDASRDRHGHTKGELAARAGAPEQHGASWCDPEGRKNVQLAHAVNFPHLVRIDLAEHVAPPGCVVCVLPAADRLVDDLRTAANIARGGGVVLEKYLTAAADGHLDRGEIADIRAAVREQLRALASLDLGLAEAERTAGRVVAHAPRLRVAGGTGA